MDVPWEGKNFLCDNCHTCIFLFYSREYAEISIHTMEAKIHMETEMFSCCRIITLLSSWTHFLKNCMNPQVQKDTNQNIRNKTCKWGQQLEICLGKYSQSVFFKHMWNLSLWDPFSEISLPNLHVQKLKRRFYLSQLLLERKKSLIT